MAVQTTLVNKPLNPRGNDQSPLAYNRAKLFSGKALDFDGVNDVVNITTSDLDFGANDFSVSAIVDWSGSHGDGKLAYAERGSSGSELAAWQIRTDGASSILFQANTAADGWQAVTFSGVEAIIADALTHLTFVRVGTGVTLYINGVFYSTGTGSIQATLDVANGAFVIGNRIGANEYWNGQIAGFKIFNTALTAAQVADLYNNPEKIVPTGVDNTALKLWLPMQEGAGTTAYDGSGNGNHGTISGATYTHGIGAPVAQTAVIDWNKGTNLTLYSEDGSVWGTGGNAPTITQDQPDPFEGTRAQRIQMDKASNYAQIVKQHTQISASVQYTAKMWLKAVSGTPTIAINYNGSGGSWQNVTLTNEWAEYEVTRTMNADYEYSHNILIGNPAPGTSSTADFYIYGLQIQLGDTAGPYVPTFGTAQTSEVLLPQGLTTGRDITGVNLFENVRKQGALNLDGNSWAEVHDNASLDITDAITLEAWVYWDGTANDGGILGRWGSLTADRNYMLYAASSTTVDFYITTVNSRYTSMTTGWHHIVGTYDKANRKLYVDGVLRDTDAMTSAISTGDKPIEIGRYKHGETAGTRLYTNDIAQPRIYNRALTAEEVQRNYDAGKNTYTN